VWAWEDIGRMVGGGGSVVGLMACLQSRDFNRVLDGCSTRVGRAPEPCKP